MYEPEILEKSELHSSASNNLTYKYLRKSMGVFIKTTFLKINNINFENLFENNPTQSLQFQKNTEFKTETKFL